MDNLPMVQIMIGLVILVVVLHVGFMLLEMVFWTKPLGRKIFRIDEDFAKKSKGLALNQGLYNGFLVAGLLWGLVQQETGLYTLVFFLGCVIIAGIVGALTVSKRIFFLQALPALLAMIALLSI